MVNLALNAPVVVLASAGFSRSVGLPLQAELLGTVVPPDIIEIHNYFRGRATMNCMSAVAPLHICQQQANANHQR